LVRLDGARKNVWTPRRDPCRAERGIRV